MLVIVKDGGAFWLELAQERHGARRGHVASVLLVTA
jgi:hypothetical protein